MRIKQRGLKIWFYRIAGTMFLLIAGFTLASVLIRLMAAFLQNQLDRDTVILIGMGSFVYIGVFGVFGVYWLGSYPDIQINDTGLEARIAFLRYQIEWGEIGGIVETKGTFKDKAILVNRKGMFWNRFYGLAVKWDQPVILVSLKAENLDVLEATIQRRLSELRPPQNK